MGSPSEMGRERAAKKKELTLALFGCFLQAIETGGSVEWRRFRDALETTLWEEALRLANGNQKEAAALVGVPYSTYIRRRPPSRDGRPAAAASAPALPGIEEDKD